MSKASPVLVGAGALPELVMRDAVALWPVTVAGMA